jgi:hypothetical protein
MTHSPSALPDPALDERPNYDYQRQETPDGAIRGVVRGEVRFATYYSDETDTESGVRVLSRFRGDPRTWPAIRDGPATLGQSRGFGHELRYRPTNSQRLRLLGGRPDTM